MGLSWGMCVQKRTADPCSGTQWAGLTLPDKASPVRGFMSAASQLQFCSTFFTPRCKAPGLFSGNLHKLTDLPTYH